MAQLVPSPDLARTPTILPVLGGMTTASGQSFFGGEPRIAECTPELARNVPRYTTARASAPYDQRRSASSGGPVSRSSVKGVQSIRDGKAGQFSSR